MGNKVKIIQSEKGIGEVYIDGVKVEGVKSTRYESYENGLPRIFLEFTPGTLNFENDVVQEIEEPTEEEI